MGPGNLPDDVGGSVRLANVARTKPRPRLVPKSSVSGRKTDLHASLLRIRGNLEVRASWGAASSAPTDFAGVVEQQRENDCKIQPSSKSADHQRVAAGAV